MSVKNDVDPPYHKAKPEEQRGLLHLPRCHILLTPVYPRLLLCRHARNFPPSLHSASAAAADVDAADVVDADADGNDDAAD